MLKDLDEVKNVEIDAGVVINGVDNANLMSVDSTEPIKTVADSVDVPGDLNVTKEEEKAVEKNTEEKDEEKVIIDKSLEEKSNAEEEEEEEEIDENFEVEPEYSKKVQKRISKITKKFRTAERERDFEKEKRLELERELEIATSQIPVDDKPQKDDFDEEDDYIEALTDWKIDNRFKESREKSTKEIEENEEKDSMLETYNGLDEIMENGNDKYDDFDKLVLDEDLVLSSVIAQVALDTESPEEVIYYLASNPEESRRISKLDPIRVAKEIGKLEVKLFSKEAEKPKPKKQSKAPAPITPVRTDGITDKDPNKMNAKEYRAWRESQK